MNRRAFVRCGLAAASLGPLRASDLAQFKSRLSAALSKHLDMLLDSKGDVVEIGSKAGEPVTAFAFYAMHQFTGNPKYRKAAVQLADRVLAQMKATRYGVLYIKEKPKGAEAIPGGGPPPLGWYASILGYIYHHEGGRDRDLEYLAGVIDWYPWNPGGWWSADIDVTTGQSKNPLSKITQVNKNAAVAMAAGMLGEYTRAINGERSRSLRTKTAKCIYEQIIPAQQSDGFWHYNLSGNDPKGKDVLGYFMLSTEVLTILRELVPSYQDKALNACLAKANDFALKSIAPITYPNHGKPASIHTTPSTPGHYDLEDLLKRSFQLGVLLFAGKNFDEGTRIMGAALDRFPYGNQGQPGSHAAHSSAVMLMLLPS